MFQGHRRGRKQKASTPIAAQFSIDLSGITYAVQT